MSAPEDFGVFDIIHQAFRTKTWFKSMKGLHTVPPPDIEPPYIVLGIEGLTSQSTVFAPRTRMECHFRVVSHQHTNKPLWESLHGVSQTLDGQCFELPGHDHLKAMSRPFIIFREVFSGWSPGLWNGRCSNVLLKYVCHIRTSRGFA